jgi:hypothetical protein
MKKLLIFSLVISISGIFNTAKADEGMWLPMFIKRLNQVDMQKHGLQLTAEEIYSINNASLKDAIVHFNGGCTAEVISNEGLLLTNHHCGYGAIADHSSAENDYLTNGFWAYKKDQELPNEGMTVSFLHRMEDVTQQVNDALNPDMTEQERASTIDKLTKELAAKASESGKYRANVSSFYNGNEFYLFVYKIYSDIRLVGAPPSSIGKFGGDTDNWMWPRHTGDFSLFRIYANQDNEPATYSADNKPYSPKYHLPVSIKGVKANDYAMILGYPGRTDRYLTSWGIEQKINVEYPAFVEARDLRLKIMKKYMSEDASVRIAYASSYAGIANYWKNRIGMIKALTENKTADGKRKIEADLKEWINADESRKAEYGEIFADFINYYNYTEKTIAGQQYLMEAGLTGSSFGIFTFRLSQQLGALVNSNDQEQVKEIQDMAKEFVEEFYAEKSIEMEKELTENTLEMYYKKTPLDQQAKDFVEIVNNYNGDFKALSNDMFNNSFITNKEELLNLIDTPDSLKTRLNDDINMKVYMSFIMEYFAAQQPSEQEMKLRENYQRAKRLFIKALRESNPDKVYYPDANSTMRLTYGNVLSYEPKDGVEYKYVTTLKGVIEKEDPSNPEFVVEKKLKDLYYAKDFGQYADENGNMPVAFLSNNDITGGNSGSPVINGKGELIGCAFDGNWEAMSGDIEFEEDLQRTISVDIRYVLFIIDKYAGATNLIDEMTIVK